MCASKPAARPARLYSLDVLRGVAAWLVVVWHWQYFYWHGFERDASFSMDALPAFAVLEFVHRSGWIAVDLFFALSGFVLFWLYADSLHDRAAVALFARRRIARIYPLHLVTLAAVAVLQWLYQVAHGVPFVYALDWPTLSEQIVLGAGALLGDGYSWNGPAWSLAVEFVLYAVFALVVWAGRADRRLVLLLAIAGASGAAGVGVHLSRGLAGFFLGGLAYLVYRWMVARRWPSWSGWLAYLVAVLLVVGCGVGMAIGEGRAHVWMALGVFPALVLMLAYGETVCGPSWWPQWVALGDRSLGVYLWHFPLQLAVVLVAAGVGFGLGVWGSWAVLAAFCWALWSLAGWSYRVIEVPLRFAVRSER